MKNRVFGILTGLCALTMVCVCASSAFGQMPEVKEKPRMYSYVSFWAIPRAQWGEMQKSNAADQPVLDKAMASGMIIGYGDDTNLLHTPDGDTHDEWWSAMSMAGLMHLLDQFYSNGSSTSSVLQSSTKHWDTIFVSRYYNWHPGSHKGVYTSGSEYKLKADAPDDAVDMIAKGLVVPLMEKFLADGTIVEYEIDTEAYHTDAPGMFYIFYLGANAESLDKVQSGVRDAVKANPLSGEAFGSFVDWSAHRDFLARTNATYK